MALIKLVQFSKKRLAENNGKRENEFSTSLKYYQQFEIDKKRIIDNTHIKYFHNSSDLTDINPS